jgi:protein phosphatase methylesterase 1
MSELQRLWARSKVGVPSEGFNEADEEQEQDAVPELPEHIDDDSSSASSVSSTGTIIPSPNQKLFARPQGYAPPRSARRW